METEGEHETCGHGSEGMLHKNEVENSKNLFHI